MRIESAGRCVRALVLCLLPAIGGCGREVPDTDGLEVAETFIDAFYSWDRDRLAALVTPGTDADAVLYYQGWAEAAHYEVTERRPCELIAADRVVCAITVTDDFGTALGYTATDTFTLSITDGRVASVTFQGDDPPVFEAVFEWLAETRPEVFSGPCRDLFAGGPTPGDCARAIARGARDYVARPAP